MERKQFLKSLGAGAAFALTFPCLHGCSSDGGEELIDGDIVEEPTGIDFRIDLTTEEASKLSENGGFILKNLVVIAKNANGEFVAVSQICAHQGYDQVRYNMEQENFYCNVHGAKYSQRGLPVNTVTNNSLKVYNVELTANVLRIFE